MTSWHWRVNTVKSTIESVGGAASFVMDQLSRFVDLTKKLIEARKIGGTTALPDEVIRQILLSSAGDVQRAVDSMMRCINVLGIDLRAAYRAARAAQDGAKADGDPESQEAQEKLTEAPEDGKPNRPAAVGGK